MCPCERLWSRGSYNIQMAKEELQGHTSEAVLWSLLQYKER